MSGYFSKIDPKTPEELAAAAIRHVLLRIRNRKPIGNLSFDYLTQALAALERQPVEEVRALFRPHGRTTDGA
jgi:hypothetical protein